MQLLSQVTTVNVPVTPQVLHPRYLEYIQRPEFKHMLPAIILAFLIWQVALIGSYWISSKALVERDKSTIRNALVLWGIYVGVSIAWRVATYFLLPYYVMLSEHDHFRAMLIMGGTMCASILIAFLIPMKLYVIGFLRALVFLLLAALMYVPVTIAAVVVLAMTMVAPQDIAALKAPFKSAPEATKFVQRLEGQEAPDDIDRLLDDTLEPIGPKPPVATREAQVRQLQQMLQARKATFPPGQPPPPAFQVQLNRYKQLLQEVIAERAAPAPAPK